MKIFPLAIAAAIALAGTTMGADAASKKKRVKAAPQAACTHTWDIGANYSYGPCGNDYTGRRDPTTWAGPLNPWDKARRDDAGMMDH